MPDNLIVVKGLSKKYCRNLRRSLWYGVKDIGSELVGSQKARDRLRKDEFWALKDIDFEIKRGELVGLVGPNGAGKTTLLKLLSGLIKPDEGEIEIRGKIQALISLGAGFNPVLTGRENIFVNGAILGFSKKEMDALFAEIVSFSEMEEFIDTPVQSYSSGMLVRLGFAVAVHLRPDILIVDEVLAVGDAFFRRKARSKMMELLHSGISVLFVSHNMLLISSITSRCIFLNQGKIEAVGPSAGVTTLYLSDSIKKLDLWKQSAPGEYMASAYLTTPDLVLEEVKLHHSSGAECRDFHTFDDIKISFQIKFLKKISNVLFAISIRDQVDEIAVGFSKVPEGKDFNRGSARIECQVVKNKLREGFYNIGFYVSDFKGGPLFKSHRVKSFKILADMAVLADSGSSFGYVVIDTQWKSLPVE